MNPERSSPDAYPERHYPDHEIGWPPEAEPDEDRDLFPEPELIDEPHDEYQHDINDDFCLHGVHVNTPCGNCAVDKYGENIAL